MAMIELPLFGGVNGMNITVVGLGLMGGSVARALKRGSGAVVTAVDRDEVLIGTALDDGIIDYGGATISGALGKADLTVVCLYPEDAVKFINANMPHFKPGSVVTDICGVKQAVIDGILPNLRDDIDFVPGHPMAGRERAGYKYSDAALFDHCNYILTPLGRNKECSIELVKRFAGALGAGAIVLAGVQEHDEMIAYTSQLPHALAVAYVLSAGKRNPVPFSAGSYRDVSRVAAINAPMWAELFMENKDALLGEITALKAGIRRIEKCMKTGDRQGLADILSAAARMKEEKA